MDEDKLLEDIGRLARREAAEERRRFDERWRRLNSGTISEEDDAALRAQAEDSEEARLDYDAFRPLDQAFRERLAARWQATTSGATANEADSPGGSPERAPPFRRPRRGSRRRYGRWLATAAALVVTVGGALLLRAPNEGRLPLPEYSTELRGALQEERSSGVAIPSSGSVFTMGSQLRLVLRPLRPVEELIERSYHFENAGGELRRWTPGYSVSTDGVIEVEGRVGDTIPIGLGRWELVVYYGRPGRLPPPGTPGSSRSSAEDWDILRLPLQVVPASADAALDGSGQPLLEVEVAGCSTASRWPACVPPGKLRLWVQSSPAARIEIRVGERKSTIEGVAVDSGRRYTVEASGDDGKVEVCATETGREACWYLTLAADTRPDGYREARRLSRKGQTEEARRSYNELLATAPAAVGASVLSRLARLQGTPANVAQSHLEQAVRLHREAGQLQEQARDTAMLVFFDFKRRDLQAAAERLEALELPEEAPAEAAFHHAYNLGMLKSEVGNYREALRWLGDAADLARRVELRQGQLADQMLATVFRRLGRTREAFELYHRLLQADLSPCARAELLNNYTWALILHPSPDNDDPLPWLEEALAILESEGCSTQDLKLDLLLNSALAHVQNGRTWEARGALADAEALAEKANRFQRLWWQDIEGRLDLRDGRGREATSRYQRMEELARQALFPEGEWRAKIGLARALELLEDRQAALDALTEAEALLDQGHLEVPLDAGREAFLAQREAGARLQMELLLRDGNDAGALAVARRSRARVLRALRPGQQLPQLQATRDDAIARYLYLRARIEAEAAAAETLSAEGREQMESRLEELRLEARGILDRVYKLIPWRPAAALSAPRAGEVVLAYHPLADGWVGFAAALGRVTSHRFTLSADLLESADELSRRLLRPFREAIRAADRIRVLPYGELRTVDFHALPFDGDVLLSGRPVVYGLDLEPAVSEAPSSRRALVVPAAPWSGLRAAEAEAQAVSDSLRTLPNPWSVQLVDDEEATAAVVRELLASDFDLFHFSGHASFEGRFGWDSALHLGAESRLTIGDILALDRVPPRVVLSGCETGLETHEAPLASLGLAQAFTIAGARSVVAAIRSVDDSETQRLFRDFYQMWNGETDPAPALRRLQLAWRKADPAADWASFRVLVP